MTATWEEITQQPEVWREVARDLHTDHRTVRDFLAPLLARTELRIVLTGAGSSAFAGELLAPAIAQQLSRRVDAIATTDLVAGPGQTLAEQVPTLLVSFARSGNSPESIAATTIAEQQLERVSHLLVTCNPAGALAAEHSSRPGSAVLLTPPQTNDRGFAMTSSFTSMVLAARLAMLGPATRRGDDPATGQPSAIDSMAQAAEQIIGNVERIRTLAEHDYQRVVYLGSGPLRAAARESSLKMLELTAGRVISCFDSVLGFRHGPKSILNDRTLAVLYASNDPYTRRYDEDMIRELRDTIGADNVLVIDGDPPRDITGRWSLPTLTGLDDELIALPYLVVAQLLAHTLSQLHGINPDNPFPGGEVNRVVQGVTIHPWTA